MTYLEANYPEIANLQRLAVAGHFGAGDYVVGYGPPIDEQHVFVDGQRYRLPAWWQPLAIRLTAEWTDGAS